MDAGKLINLYNLLVKDGSKRTWGKILYPILIFTIFGLCVFIDQKCIYNRYAPYKRVNKNTYICGKVISTDEYKGTIHFILSNNKKYFSLTKCRFINGGPKTIDDIICTGDSVYKNYFSDTIYLVQGCKKYYWIIE
jgi:hypothetical protein